MPITLRKAVSVTSLLVVATLLAASVTDADSGAREQQANGEPTHSEVHFQPLARVSSLKKKRRISPYIATVTNAMPSSAAPTYAFLERTDITEHHKKLATTVFSALPASCASNIRTFSIIYKDAKYRGLGGKSTIILDGSVIDTEFTALLIHECGHVISGNMIGSSQSGESAFRDGKSPFYNDGAAVSFFAVSWENERTLKKGTKDADFISGYASSDIFEDFAETFAAYVLQRPYLRTRAKTNKAIAQKLAWMEANIPLSETAVGNTTYKGTKDVPWDVTKLPYASLLEIKY